ncbi:MAG TPA: tetratricopeptide repeat protein [Acidisarcina sp.]
MHRWLVIAGLFLAAVASCASAQDATAPASGTGQSSNPSAQAPRKALKKSAAPDPSHDPISDPIPDAPAPAGEAAQGTTAGNQDAVAPTETIPAETTGAPAGKKRSTADNNPFPEDFSKAAAKDGGDTAPPDAAQTDAPPTNSKSSDSRPQDSRQTGYAPSPTSTPDSSSQQGLDKLDLYGDKDKRHKKNADPDAGLPYDPKLAAQDNKIGELYLKNGNAPGAYSRFKEASQYDAGNADAVFGLAEAARQMNLPDEAIQAYQTYLFAFPDGPKARQAKKALAELKVKDKR